MYLRDLSHWDDESPLIVGPFRSDAQAEAFVEKVGHHWRSDGATVLSPAAYLKRFGKQMAEE
jgi:hypothetical protein